MVNPDVILDGLQLCRKCELRLHQGSELSLVLPLQLVDLVEVLLDDDDVGLDDVLDNIHVAIVLIVIIIVVVVLAVVIVVALGIVLVLILILVLILTLPLVRGFCILSRR